MARTKRDVVEHALGQKSKDEIPEGDHVITLDLSDPQHPKACPSNTHTHSKAVAGQERTIRTWFKVITLQKTYTVKSVVTETIS